MRISVAMCTRNGAPFVERQLRSILDGSRRPDQLVVCDDESSDETLEIVRAVTDAARMDVLIEQHDPAFGVTGNFARAIELCDGDLIVLSDQDDVWHFTRLARLAASLADANGPLLRHSDARLIDAAGEPVGGTLFERLSVAEGDLAAIEGGGAFPVYLRRNIATGATTAFRRELLSSAVPIPLEWVHDEWLAVLAAARERIEVEPGAELDYRLHADNQIGVAERTLRRQVARVLHAEPGRNRALARRSEILGDRLEALGLDAQAAAARGKADFETRRAVLPALRVARLGAVLRMLRSGLYGRYASQGALDSVRDLLQPR